MKLPRSHNLPSGYYAVTFISGGGAILLDPRYYAEENCIECMKVAVDGMDVDLEGTVYIDMGDVKAIEPIGPEKLEYAQATSADRSISQRLQLRMEAAQVINNAQNAGVARTSENRGPGAGPTPIRRVPPPRS